MSNVLQKKAKKKRVLNIGSVLLDVISTVDANSDYALIDNYGSMNHFRIGGCAYNTAYCCRAMGAKAEIITALKPKSITTSIIKAKIKRLGIRHQYTKYEASVHEPVFNAHQVGNEIRKAITSTLVNRVNFDENILRKAIGRNDVTIIDLSLNLSTISLVSKICAELEKPLICNATSESLIKDRILNASDTRIKFDLMIMNKMELKSVSEDDFEEIKKIVHSSNFSDEEPYSLLHLLPKRVHSRSVIATFGGAPYLYVNNQGKCLQLHPPLEKFTGSTVGASNGLTAVAAMCFTSINRDVDFTNYHEMLKDVLEQVLNSSGATPDAEQIFNPKAYEFHVNVESSLFNWFRGSS